MSGWDVIVAGLVKAVQLILTGDPTVLQITFLSIAVSGTATLLGALIGIPTGAAISLKQFRGKSAVVQVVNTLTGLPPVVVGLILYLLLSNSGPLGFLKLLYTPQAMILAQLLMVVPITTSITISSVSSIDPEVREAATSLGAGPLSETMIVLNEARLGLLTSVVVGFGSAISEVGAIMMVGGNLLGYTRALTTAIVLLTNQGEFAEAIALGIVLLSLAFVVNIVLTLLRSRFAGTSSYTTSILVGTDSQRNP
jgi:tungstate transport system permease protein